MIRPLRLLPTLVLLTNTVATPQETIITGQVLNTNTRSPIARALVRVVPDQGAAGVPGAIPKTVATARTTADGRYRITGLPYGDYHVSVSRTGFLAPPYSPKLLVSSFGATLSPAIPSITNGDLGLVPQAVLAVTVIDDASSPAQGVEVFLARLGRDHTEENSTTDDRGETRLPNLRAGRFIVSARPSLLAFTNTGEREQLIETFYPSVLSPDEATVVDLKPGQETRVTIQQRRATLYRVRGHVDPSSIAPSAVPGFRRGGAGYVNLQPTSGHNRRVLSSLVTSEGEFDIDGVPSGTYAFTLDSRRLQAAGTGARAALLEVTNADITGLQLRPVETVTLNGKFRFESKSQVPLRNDPIRGMDAQLSALSLDASESNGVSYAEMKPTGEFTFRNLAVGEYKLHWGFTISPGEAPRHAYVKAIQSGSQSVESPLLHVFTSTAAAPLEILISTNTASAQITVPGLKEDDSSFVLLRRDDDGPETPLVNVFDPLDHWTVTEDHVASFEGLQPGTYHALALDAYDEREGLDPAVWNRFATRTTTLKLAEGQTAKAEAKLISAAELETR